MENVFDFLGNLRAQRTKPETKEGSKEWRMISSCKTARRVVGFGFFHVHSLVVFRAIRRRRSRKCPKRSTSCCRRRQRHVFFTHGFQKEFTLHASKATTQENSSFVLLLLSSSCKRRRRLHFGGANRVQWFLFGVAFVFGDCDEGCVAFFKCVHAVDVVVLEGMRYLSKRHDLFYWRMGSLVWWSRIRVESKIVSRQKSSKRTSCLLLAVWFGEFATNKKRSWNFRVSPAKRAGARPGTRGKMHERSSNEELRNSPARYENTRY